VDIVDSKVEKPLDAGLRRWASVDVIAEEPDGIRRRELALDLCQQIVQRVDVAVNITDRQRGHMGLEVIRYERLI